MPRYTASPSASSSFGQRERTVFPSSPVRLVAKKKLSRVLIDSKVPADERKDILVLAEGSHILWIPELARCSAYYYIDENTKKVLCASIY